MNQITNTEASIVVDPLGELLLKRLLKIVLAYQIAALCLIAGWVYLTFNGSDWIILGVPQNVLLWSLIGAVAGALYRLSNYPRLSVSEKAVLYLWVVAKPFVGTALGGVIYFLAVGGVLMLQGNSKIDHVQLLSAIGFFAAFSDRFAFSMLDRLSMLTKKDRRSRDEI